MPLVINGWKLLSVPEFDGPYGELIEEVQRLKEGDPTGYTRKNATKRLAAIQKLILEDIPADPSDPRYRQGDTLGAHRKHWFRAKFFQQYRLFFQYDDADKTIVYAWVNDESTKRAYESRSDAYEVFKKMINNGAPPNNWSDLRKAATTLDPAGKSLGTKRDPPEPEGEQTQGS